jgi:hypothetical protein
MKNWRHNFLCLLTFLAGLTNLTVSAQNPVPGQFWLYRLLEGSVFTRDSLIGGPPTIEVPIRGTFELTLHSVNPLSTIYDLTNIVFASAGGVASDYQVTGTGIYQVGGEVAVAQDMRLETQVSWAGSQEARTFTNAVRGVIRRWPVLEIELEQADANLLVFYRLHLRAAPVRDLWFSTSGGLTDGAWAAPTNHVSGGDLLSISGRIVQRNMELTKGLGIMPVVPDLGLAGVDVAAGAEILWVADQGVFSEFLGPIQQGDVLSNRGRIVKRNQALLAAFGIDPKAADAGLDALHVDPSGEIFFSIRTNVYSPVLAVMLGRGDVLTDRGRRIKTNQALLAGFQPTDTKTDYGLDALYIWPSGETWFSTETGFMDQQLGAITSGDLLSDEGYIVFHNLELVGAFQPLEDLSNFGLDALFVVTDDITPAVAPQMSGVLINPSAGELTFSWAGNGKVFQLEKAGAVTGPYIPLSPIVPELEFSEAWDVSQMSSAFYRVRQW